MNKHQQRPSGQLEHRLAIGVVLLVSLSLGGCAQLSKKPLVQGPTVIEPPPPTPPVIDGSIFQPGQPMNYGYQPIFEDRHPRNVGDTLTVLLDENMSATKNSSVDSTRDGGGALSFLFGSNNQNLKFDGKNNFDGKGGAAAKNTFSGTITVTVKQILANGDLSIVGEKQIEINQGTEFIRFSGVVDPRTISGNNTVESTQIADARIEYIGNGYIDESQHMGWLQRLWLNISPF